MRILPRPRAIQTIAAIAFSAVALLSWSFAHGAVYWDTNGTAAGSGNSSGNWWASDWNSDSIGGSAGTISAWPSGSDAVMSAGTDGVGNLTITVTGSPLVGNLTVAYGNITLGGTGSFSLNSSATWTANAGTSLVVQTGISTESLLTVGGSGNSTYGGVIGGGASLTKTGSGLVTLASANTFSGTTSISGGTLDLAQASALQFSTLIASGSGTVEFDQGVSGRLFNIGGLSGSGNLALQNTSGTPAAITLNVGGNGGNTTYSGVLSGSGALTKSGNGLLALAATNTYTGGTTISGGTLQLGTGASGYDGSVAATGGILDNANLVFDLYGNQTYSGAIGGVGNLAKAGSGILTLSGSSNFSGNASISGGTLDVANSTALQFATLVVPTSGLVLDKSVTGNAFVVGNLSGSGNMALQNSASTPAAISLAVGGNNTTSEYYGTLSGSGSLTLTDGGTLILANTNSFTGGTTVSGGVLQFGDGTAGHDGLISGSIVNNSAVTFDFYGSESYGGAISGSGALTTSGSSLVTLTNASSFSGGTSIDGGTLQLGNGATGHDGTLSGSGSIVNSSVLVADLAGSQTIAASILGSGSLAKTGSGVLTLTAAEFYTGSTTISAGTLQLGSGSAGSDGQLSGTGGVIDNSALAFNLAGSQSYADVISGSGSLTKLGSGSLTLSGTNNSYSGGTTVTAGLLAATSTAALPGFASSSKLTVGASGALALSTGTAGWTSTAIGSLLTANSAGFASGSMLGLDTTSGGFTYAGAIPGSLGLTKLGPNSLVLTASNTYAGRTTISAGTLQLGDGTSGHDGSISATGGISDSATLAYDLYGTESYSGAIAGVGGLVKAGTGTLVLQGSNTFSGATSMLSGTLDLANSAALSQSMVVTSTASSLVFDQAVTGNAFSFGNLGGSGSVTLQNNASSPAAVTLNVGGNQSNSVFFGTLSGSGALAKTGTGMLTLAGSNSFTGGTVVTNGTLQLGTGQSGHDGSLLTSGSIANNSTLAFDLYGSQTYAGVIGGSGNLLIVAGSVTLAPSASVTASAGNFELGVRSGSALTVSNSASLTVGGELDVNYASTVSGNTGYLNLQGGTLSVSGPVTVGHARMDTSPTDTSALVNQTGGTLAAGGPMTIGLIGAAQSIYDISGGSLSAASGLTVNAQGNGVLNVSGSGSVTVSSTNGLSIGNDPIGATGGTVSLAGGTLAISGDTTLGNTGLGTLVRTGGVLTAGGNLVAGGAGTLVLNGSGGSVATYFSGQLEQANVGTLVVIPYNNLLGGNEALSFGESATITNGTLGPWAVRETSGTDSTGDYLTLTGTSAPYSLGAVSYTSTNFASSSGTSLVNVTGSPTIASTSAYAVKFGNTVTTLSGTLTLTSGGMILNGGTLTGSGGVWFTSPGDVEYGIQTWDPVTGMVFAGSSTASAIAVPINTTQGMVKFGPGTLVLSGNNRSLFGGIVVNSGILSAQNSGALGAGGAGNEVLVAGGAELDMQGNIALPDVELSIGGMGVGGTGALHNVSGSNSFAGLLNLTNNLQVSTESGSLTLYGPLQGSYNLTKAGTGTLALTADSSFGFTGNVNVMAGTLDVSNSGALGTVGGGGVTTISNSATLTIHNNVVVPQSLVLSGSGSADAGALVNTQDDNSISGPVQLAGNTLIATNAGSLDLFGPVSGSYSLTKSGSGLLVLSGVNTFSGSLSASAGTLSIPTMNNAGSAGPLGLSTSSLALGASGSTTTFDYSGVGDTSSRGLAVATGGTVALEIDDPAATLTLTGSISGSGALVKTGFGTLTIGGTATFGGQAYVSEGVLAIGPAGSLTNSATISVSPDGLLQLTNSGNTQLSSSATISLNGSQLTFNGNGASSSSGEIVGNLLLGAGENDITVGASTSGTYQPYLKFASLPSTHTIGASLVLWASAAQVQLQSGSNTNGILGGYIFYNGTDFAALSGGTVAAYSSYTTGDLGSLSASSSMNVEPGGLQTSVTASKTINSLNLTGATGVQMTGTGALTLGSGGLIANTTGGIRGGTLKGSASGELTVYLAQDINVSSTITNNGGPTALVVSGPGTLTLSGSTTYTGDTYLNNGGLVLIPPANTTYGGAIHGPGDLTKSGPYSLTLTGTSDFSGDATLTGGELCVNGSLGSISGLSMQSSSVLAGSGAIGGDVTATGGTIGLSSGGSIAGAVSISSGTLTIGMAGVGNYLSTGGGLNVTDGAVLVVSPSATIIGNVNISSSAQSSFSGTMSGSGSVLTLDPPTGGTLTLATSAASTYGGVVLAGGTLKVANSAAVAGNSLTVDGGTLDLGGWTSLPITTLSGSGGVIETSSGTTQFVVSPGSSVTGDFGGSIVNGGGLVSLLVSGSGTLVLAGSDTYSGGTIVSGGELVLATADGLLEGSSLTVGDAGSFSAAIASPLTVGAAPVEAPTVILASPAPEPATLSLALLAGGIATVLIALRKRIGGKPHV